MCSIIQDALSFYTFELHASNLKNKIFFSAMFTRHLLEHFFDDSFTTRTLCNSHFASLEAPIFCPLILLGTRFVILYSLFGGGFDNPSIIEFFLILPSLIETLLSYIFPEPFPFTSLQKQSLSITTSSLKSK